jgi:hypothetical protein
MLDLLHSLPLAHAHKHKTVETVNTVYNHNIIFSLIKLRSQSFV